MTGHAPVVSLDECETGCPHSWHGAKCRVPLAPQWVNISGRMVKVNAICPCLGPWEGR